MPLPTGSGGAQEGPATESGEDDSAVSAPERPALFDELETGQWGWSQGKNRCDDNPHSIEFSDDGREMLLTRAHSTRNFAGAMVRTSRYDVLDVQDGVVRMKLRGEGRRTEEGELVVWDLRLLGPSAYCWHRTDWPAADCTNRVVRCGGEGAVVTGIAECDDLLEKLERCIDTADGISAAARSDSRSALDETRANWRAAAQRPENKEALVRGCIEEEKFANQLLEQLNCEW